MGGAWALFHTDGHSEVVAAAEARSPVQLLVTIGADRPPDAVGFEELVTAARSALKISPSPTFTMLDGKLSQGRELLQLRK